MSVSDMIRIFILSIGRSDSLTNKYLAATVIRHTVMKKLPEVLEAREVQVITDQRGITKPLFAWTGDQISQIIDLFDVEEEKRTFNGMDLVVQIARLDGQFVAGWFSKSNGVKTVSDYIGEEDSNKFMDQLKSI